MATTRIGHGATGGCEGVSVAVTSADQWRPVSVEPRDLSGPTAPSDSARCRQPQQEDIQQQQQFHEQQQQQQQQHHRKAESVISEVTWPDQTLEEQRREFMSRLEKSKAYGAYLLHQADLRRQRDLLEKLTRHNYSAGIPVSSTHEAFAAPSITDTASVAAAEVAVSTARRLKEKVRLVPSLRAEGGHRNPTFSAALTEGGVRDALASPLLLRQHQPDDGDGSSLSQQILVQQQLLYQQQQCLLQQQQQQELLRQQQEQQKLLQQQQQQLLQQQQRLLEYHQPPKRKESQTRAAEPTIAFAGNRSAKSQLNESSSSYDVLPSRAEPSFTYPPNSATTGRTVYTAVDASSAIDHCTFSPVRRADPAGASRAARSDAVSFDADLSPPAEENIHFPKAMPASVLHPALPPRLRRAQEPHSRLAATAALGLHHQQEQQLRRLYEEERRAYGAFLKHQIAQRKAAEKAEKELEKRLYGVAGAASVAGGFLERVCTGAGAKFRSSHGNYDKENLQCYPHPLSHVDRLVPADSARRAVENSTAKRVSKVDDSGAASVGIAEGAQGVGDGSSSNKPENSVSFNTSEKVLSLHPVDPTTSNGHRRGNSLSMQRCSSSDPPRREMSTERSGGVEDDEKFSLVEAADAAAAAAAAKKKKQQEYREFLLMQIEQKRSDRKVAGRKGTPPAEDDAGQPKPQRNFSVEASAAEKRLRSRSCFSEPSDHMVDFEEGPGSEAAFSPPATAAKVNAAEPAAASALAAADTGREYVSSDFALRRRRGRKGKGIALSSSSRGRLGVAEEPLQLDGAQEEHQRLRREQERRKAYQAALLEQIHEREEARERQRQEKLREQEKERQVSYEALEQERRNMRTGRKNVNNVAFASKDTNSDESATATTTAGAEVDSPYNLEAARTTQRVVATEDCCGNAPIRRNLHVLDEELPQAISVSPAAAAATKQSTPRNLSSAATAVALSRSSSSAALASSPTACRQQQKQQQQHQEALCGAHANQMGSLLSNAVAALQEEEKAPKILGNLASCLQTVHLEIQKQQEELRSMKLQQQLSAFQHRVHQDELTRFLSALTHRHNPSTAHAASGSATAGTTAARIGGRSSCCLQHQHQVVLHSCNCPDCLSISCRAEFCDKSSTVAQTAATEFWHGPCFAEERGSAEEEAVAALAAGVPPAAPASGVVALEGDASSLERDSGPRTAYAISHALPVAPLSPGQHHCHQHIRQSHGDQHYLLQQEAHKQQQKSDNSTKHMREGEADGAEGRNADKAAVASRRQDKCGEQCEGAEGLSNSPGRAAAEVSKGIRAASPPRRQRSSRVNEIIDSFTRWLKPAAYQRREMEGLPPRRSASFSSVISSKASALQLPAAERCNPAVHSVTFPQFMLHQQQQKQQQQRIRTQWKCNACNASEGSCGCSSTSNPHVLQLQQDRHTFSGITGAMGVNSSLLQPSPLFLPVAEESASSIPHCSRAWRGGCISPLAAQKSSDVPDCGLHQESRLSHAGAVTGIAATSSSGERRKCCATGLSTAAAAAAAQSPSGCCCAVSTPTPSCSCSYAFKDTVASGCLLHMSNSCSVAAAHKQASPIACHQHSSSTHACNQLQQCTHACCCCLSAAGAGGLQCPRRQHGLQVPCNSHEPQQQEMHLMWYLEQQQQQFPEDIWIGGEPEQEQRFIQIRDEDPLEAPSFVESVDETAQQRQAAEKQKPDFMRFSTEKDHYTAADGALSRSLSLAPPANRFMLRRWLGGIVPPPPSKDFPEQQKQDHQQDLQQQQQQKAESEQSQQQKGKEERRLLWRGGRSKAQHRGSVERTRSAAAAAAASEKSRRVTTTPAGSNSSDKVGDVKRRGKNSLRVSTAAATTPDTKGAPASAVGGAAAEAGIERQGSTSGVRGLLGLLGHVWDRRRRVEDDKIMDGEGRDAPVLRMSERMKMRLSWDTEQPWDLLLQQGAAHGEFLLSATAAELQRCLEEDEQAKQRRQRLQQLRLQQLQQDRKHAEVCFAPNIEEDRKEQLTPGGEKGESPIAARQKKEQAKKKGGWRRPSRSADNSKQQHQQEKGGNKSYGDNSIAEADGGGGTHKTGSSAEGKQQTQSSAVKDPAPYQTNPPVSPFTSAPPTPTVPPEPHKKPKNLKR